MSYMQRPGRICGDELDKDTPAAALRSAATVPRALTEYCGQFRREPSRRKPHVNKAWPGNLRVIKQPARPAGAPEGGGKVAGELSRLAANRFRGNQRGVRRKVASDPARRPLHCQCSPQHCIHLITEHFSRRLNYEFFDFMFYAHLRFLLSLRGRTLVARRTKGGNLRLLPIVVSARRDSWCICPETFKVIKLPHRLIENMHYQGAVIQKHPTPHPSTFLMKKSNPSLFF